MRELKRKYGHAWPLIFGVIYLIWFVLLEIFNVSDYHIIHCTLDDYIPFCEYFVIPYFLWFLYIPSVFIFIFLKSKDEFYRLCAYMFSGMLIALFICTIFPNGQQLRIVPEGDSIFSNIVRLLYQADTSTNSFPSVHVFNSIAAHVCLVKSSYIKKGHPVKWASFILIILICLSTMFLKQHSVLDVAGGAVLALILYFVIFHGFFKKK